jgi:gas vesicle protein
MSQQDNFVGGFLLGTLVGGVVGGVVGVLVTSRLSQAELPDAIAKLDSKRLDSKRLENKDKKRQIKPTTEQGMEVARRGLEDKIAQLNEAIDDVRQQLGTVNGTPKEPKGQAIAPQDP